MKRTFRFLLLFLLLCISFRQAAVIRDHSNAVSLRFDSEFSSAQAQGFDAVWAEERESVSGLPCTVIRFDGDAQLAFPAVYPYGAPPNSLMPECCAVSTDLAWELFGGEDVTGLTVELDSAEYTICGVLTCGEPVLLLPDSEGFTAAELWAPSARTDLYRYAQDRAAQAGLPEPTQILCGPEAAYLSGLLPWLCAVLAAWPLLRRTVKYPAVLCLPLLLLLPVWFLPTRWSDTVFWSELFRSLSSRFLDWLTLAPALRDVSVKRAWFQMGTALLLAQSIQPPERAAVRSPRSCLENTSII